MRPVMQMKQAAIKYPIHTHNHFPQPLVHHNARTDIDQTGMTHGVPPRKTVLCDRG
jgi:hypothetical protein